MLRDHRFRLLLFCALLLGMPFAAHAASTRYHYDPVHSQVLFSIDHDGYSRPFGRLHIAKGWLQFDTKDWSTAATELDIDLASPIYGMHTVAGFSATASLQRESFGINAFAHSIGHDVAIWMELEAIRGDDAKSSTKDTP
jgi:polyisoprenoid-binding protein YceI